MNDIGPIALILIFVTVVFTYKGFIDRPFFKKYKFWVNPILYKNDFVRLVSSGFLHANWLHFGLNMLSLYAFSAYLELDLGWLAFVAIYFSSLIGGNLFALFVHRNHGDYSAIGASGAVCGVIFACIALIPGIKIYLFGIPQGIAGWLFGLVFVAISIFGIKTKRDNIGHEAHLGGALVGMIVGIAFRPEVLNENLLTIIVIALPTVLFIYLILMRPHILMINGAEFEAIRNDYDIDHSFNKAKSDKQKELDRILDKIRMHGMDSLTKEEMKKLDGF